MRSGRKSAAQTPAPKKDRIYGSKTNPKGSASSEKSAKSIVLSDKTMKSLQGKLKEFKEKHPAKKNITLNDLKAVYRRGLGAYSSSHRPTITGGVPNTRNAWAMARVNKFLLKAGGTKVKAAYVQDDDLMARGGTIDKGAVNYGMPNVDWSEMPLIHETKKEIANKIKKDGFVVTTKNNTKGVYTIPTVLKKERFNPNDVELIVWLKPDSKILWTNTENPSDFYVGYGNKFYQKIYKELNPNWERTLKNQSAFIGSDEQGKFCRRLEDWLSNNGYCGVQQGGEVVITDLDCIDYVEDRSEEFADGGLIAPNGKPSNLTPEQYKLVRTTEFKAWFGDWENSPETASKVVDENGEPLVVYHYSPNQFTIFDKTKHLQLVDIVENKKHKPLGYDFSTKEGFYESKTRNKKYSVFLNAKNVFDFRKATEKEFDKITSLLEKIPYYSTHSFQLNLDIKNLKNGDWDLLERPTLEKYFSKNYDGLFMKENDWLNVKVYNSNQIKLADGSNTTFDANSPDIRFAEGGRFDDQELLKKYKAGESIGFTAIAHLKAKGLIARADGTKRKSDKYKEMGGNVDEEIKLPDLNMSYGALKETLNYQGYDIEPMKQDFQIGKVAKGMSVQQIAQHHNATVDEIQKQLDKGIQVEMEHTDNQDIARAIALDHVYESPIYYDKLETIEKEFKDGGVVVGKRHSEYDENGSGEKFLVESTGQVVELEGGEGVLCQESMSSDKKFSFEGKSMTGREIASYLNHKYGGVEFAKGGEVKKIDKIKADMPHVCGCKHQYYHGGEVPTAVVRNLKGGEAVVTVKSMESKDQYNFNGKPMTPRQIFSQINMASGGKKFEDGGVINLQSIKDDARLEFDIQLAKMMYYVTTLKQMI
jgi:hypothetical protein